jgi:hypothetical protein
MAYNTTERYNTPGYNLIPPPCWNENLRLRSTNGMSICVSIGGNTIQFRDYGR